MGRLRDGLGSIPLIWRKFLAWMAIAIVLGGVSVVMTMQITHVDERSPLDLISSRMGDESESAPGTEVFHGQFISVLTTGASRVPDPVDIRYYTRTFGAMDAGPKSLASIQFTVVENQAVKLIFSHLKESDDLPHCLSGGLPTDALSVEPDKAGVYWVNPRIVVVGKRRFAELTYAASETPITVVCGITPDVRRQTFTARATRFSFFQPGGQLTLDAGSRSYLETFPDPKRAYRDYQPVGHVPITFSLNGVEAFAFQGGRPNLESNDYDQSRIVDGWGWTEISWEETPRKQQRDILLIMIGTIIAIAVTALIEAVRPFIEIGLEPKAPAGRPNRYRRRRDRHPPS